MRRYEIRMIYIVWPDKFLIDSSRANCTSYNELRSKFREILKNILSSENWRTNDIIWIYFNMSQWYNYLYIIYFNIIFLNQFYNISRQICFVTHYFTCRGPKETSFISIIQSELSLFLAVRCNDNIFFTCRNVSDFFSWRSVYFVLWILSPQTRHVKFTN